MNTNISPQQQRRRKAWLFLPLIVLPFLVFIFNRLGGGSGPGKANSKDTTGYNPKLPAVHVKDSLQNTDKFAHYQRANADSIKRQEARRQDPYQQPTPPPIPAVTQLQRQLDYLQHSLSAQPISIPKPSFPNFEIPNPKIPQSQILNTTPPDPQLQKIDTLLTKIREIQHPEVSQSQNLKSKNLKSEIPSIVLRALITESQTLTTGGSISLRLLDSLKIGTGTTIPKNQCIYGQANLSGERLQISIHNIEIGQTLYPVDLTVYDLDGLAGIHIPDLPDRQIAKESAGQSISGLDLATFDPSLAAQAATAGIQTAKNLLSRKVRLIKVTVPSGYRVLLKSQSPNQ